MEKKKLYSIAAVVIVAAILVPSIIVAVVLLTPAAVDPCAGEEDILLFTGNGLKNNYTYSVCDLQKSTYQQYTNVNLSYTTKVETTYAIVSGVSLWDFINKNHILKTGIDSDTTNVTFAASGYTITLNLTTVQTYPADIIIVYGGDDFDPIVDGPLRSAVSNNVLGLPTRTSKYWVSNLENITISV